MGPTPALHSHSSALLVAGVMLVLLLLPALTTPTPHAVAAAPAAPPVHGPPALSALRSIPPAAVGPQVTAIYDWDTQPLLLDPSFPLQSVAGEGAVMAASDPLRTLMLFGGESAGGLVNYTITASQVTGAFDVSQPSVAPSPRANSSVATVDNGRYAVLFGGLTNLTTQSTDNQTWVFDYTTRIWTNHTGPVAPPPRESAAFAAPAGNGSAVLEGGWDPSYSVGGAGATVYWNDTWLLNLTTFNWTRSNASGAPRPMFGSSLTYDPVSQRFFLFGGCATFCTNQMYTLRPGGNWTHVATTGDVPGPRASASAGYSPAWDVILISGGFVWGGNDFFALNDTFAFTPATLTWDLVVSAGGPTARFGAPAAYLNANNCPGFLMYGGSEALQLPPTDGWFLDSNPDLQSGCNIWGGDQVGGGGGPPANCSTPNSLQIQVLDNATHRPIPNGSVSISGICGKLQLKTDALGFVNITKLPSEVANVVVAADSYHSYQAYLNFTIVNGTRFTVFLERLPVLQFRTWGLTFLGGIAPLDNVSIVAGSIQPLGYSNASGWLNVTTYAGPQGSTVFHGYKAGYSNASETVNVPYTGYVNITLTLLAYGTVEIHVVEYPDGTGIGYATGLIVPVGSYTFGGPQNYTANEYGWANVSLPQANYTITANAPGFVSNSTRLPVFVPWVVPTPVVINLTLLRGADLSVQLRDVRTHAPIYPGIVQVGYFKPENTSTDGWANFTNILPPGWYTVTGSASGYESNSTSIQLNYLSQYPNLTLYLTPLPTCANCQTSHNETPGAYRLLPAGGESLELFLLAPVLLALAGVAYALYVRRQATQGPS